MAETGLIMSTLALYPAQVDLLATHPDSPQSAALSGPPGTGKTVVLVLKGLQWLRQGRTVHVVSGDGGSRSISFLIEAALRAEARRQDTAAGPPASASGGMVQRHQLDYISRVAAAVDELASLAWDGQLFVIMDESFSWPHRLVVCVCVCFVCECVYTRVCSYSTRRGFLSCPGTSGLNGNTLTSDNGRRRRKESIIPRVPSRWRIV